MGNEPKGFLTHGYVERPGLSSRKTFRAARKIRGRDAYRFMNAEEIKRELCERQVMICCAGAIGNTVIGRRYDDEHGGLGDEEAINELQKDAQITDKRVAELRRRTERIIRRDYVRETIECVGLRLVTTHTLTAKEIRATYKKFRAIFLA
jgi:hypothetical protein